MEASAASVQSRIGAYRGFAMKPTLLKLSVLALATGLLVLFTGSAPHGRIAVLGMGLDGGLVRSVAANRSASPSAMQYINALRAASGIPATDTGAATINGCPFSTTELLRGEAVENAGDGLPSTTVLIGALAPQTTRLGNCLAPSSGGYQAPTANKLYGYPADGATGVSVVTPFLLFAAGPWVENPDGSSPYLFRQSDASLTVVPVSGGKPIQLRYGLAPFSTPGFAFTLWDFGPLDTGTRYRATATLNAPGGSQTITWTFTTSPSVMSRSGQTAPHLAFSVPAHAKSGARVSFHYWISDRLQAFSYNVQVSIGSTNGKLVANSGSTFIRHGKAGGTFVWPKAKRGRYTACLVAMDLGDKTGHRALSLACSPLLVG